MSAATARPDSCRNRRSTVSCLGLLRYAAAPASFVWASEPADS